MARPAGQWAILALLFLLGVCLPSYAVSSGFSVSLLLLALSICVRKVCSFSSRKKYGIFLLENIEGAS
jgi:hypothetical protein